MFILLLHIAKIHFFMWTIKIILLPFADHFYGFILHTRKKRVTKIENRKNGKYNELNEYNEYMTNLFKAKCWEHYHYITHN